MALPMAHLQHQLQVAREMSLLGDYSSAAAYFECVLDAVAKMASGADSSQQGRWSHARRSVQRELEAVNALQKVKDGFCRPSAPVNARGGPPAAYSKPVRQPNNIPVEIVTPDDRRRDVPTEPEEDPDVWRPPSRGPPQQNRRLPPRQQDDKKLPSWAVQDKPAPSRGNVAKAPKGVAPKVDTNNKLAPVRNNGRKVNDEVALRGEDAVLLTAIERDIIDSNFNISFDDIAGLELPKRVLEESVIWPLWSPWLFDDLARPPRGVLLFGPPGTGKTLLAKAIATECRATFFSVSPTTLGSKYRGESEKMVRMLFDLARQRAPSIIFIDEVDSLCSKRGESSEHEASRRVKSEFLTMIDGCNNGTSVEGEAKPFVLVLGATNFPWDLDEAMRRRLDKRVLVGLPDYEQRKKLFHLSLKNQVISPDVDLDELARRSNGYSGDDCANICRRAAMSVIRRQCVGKSKEEIQQLKKNSKAPILMKDFVGALESIKPSVSTEEVKKHEEWFKTWGAT